MKNNPITLQRLIPSDLLVTEIKPRIMLKSTMDYMSKQNLQEFVGQLYFVGMKNFYEQLRIKEEAKKQAEENNNGVVRR